MQVTVEGAGTLGIVVGADWSVLNHIPPDLNPPYLVNLGREQSDDPVVFYVASDHYSETRRRNIISPEAARAAMRHFATTASCPLRSRGKRSSSCFEAEARVASSSRLRNALIGR